MKIVKLSIAIVLLLSSIAFIEDDSKQFEISKNLEIFTNIYKELNTHYVDDVDPSRLMRVGIEAMLETLDPYTNYISEADIEGYRYMSEGKYDGIGARVRKMGDYVTVVEPYEGGPAIDAGLRAGDMIIAVEGKSAKDKKTAEVEEILKGFPGTEVNITIKRPGEDTERNVAVKRDEVAVKNVPYQGMLDDKTGYVVLTTFTNNAGKNISQAIKKLKEEYPGMQNLVFDLRNNGGGYLREAVSISNLFISKGETVVTTKGKVRDRDRGFKTSSPPEFPDLPVVVLTNKWTASASEIVSGVLQDLDRGVILGTRTYGKGLVQNTVDLEYNSKLKLTTAKYYIPSGRCIQSVSYKDGEPVDIPDNKRAVFKTRAGRKVLDGGGIIPDVMVDEVGEEPIVKFLVDNNLIFYYATKYHQEHEEIGSAKDFAFTDFAEFVAFVESKNIDFKTDTETKLDELLETAETDQLTDLVGAKVKEMKEKIAQEKADDLEQNKATIISLIEKEIVSRYYYQTGRTEKSLRNDAEIKLALEILNDQERYQNYFKR
ncbi:MAG: PDZ domain-containing protein [Saprospiraceae bacterium]|nr:PDZ domain-containing protein [Saprospiraceae bacterium]